jgi:hypothetical protein
VLFEEHTRKEGERSGGKKKKTFSIKAESSDEGISSQIAIWNVILVVFSRKNRNVRQAKKKSLSLFHRRHQEPEITK